MDKDIVAKILFDDKQQAMKQQPITHSKNIILNIKPKSVYVVMFEHKSLIIAPSSDLKFKLICFDNALFCLIFKYLNALSIH